jgi:LPXTG-motif cell wall-anchored protein
MKNPLAVIRPRLPAFLVLFGVGGILGAEESMVSNPWLGVALVLAGAGLYVARRQDVSPI